MNRIKRLSNTLINRMASGNVVSSQSCILKELLENSLDAHSTKIVVYLENNGFNLIKVIDNGEGISKNDLITASNRYTTSRIKSLEDLNNIKSYGFRGEALFAIKSIAELEIISKVRDQDTAWRIFFGKFYEGIILEPSSGENGTSVSVKNFSFFNNFDFSYFINSSIFEDIYYVFKFIALSKFNVHFILYKDGVEYKNLPPCFNKFSKQQRIDELCGKFKFDRLFDLFLDSENIDVSGFISIGKKKRNKGSLNFIYVNDRFVYDRFIDEIIYKLSSKYLLKTQKFFYCFYFYLDPSHININLGPKKLDIKFNFLNFYSYFYNYLLKFFDDQKLSIKQPRKKFFSLPFHENDNYFFMNEDLSKKKLFSSNNCILTLLDDMFLVFKMDKELYGVGLKKLRGRILFDIALNQFVKFNKLSSKQVVFYKFINTDRVDLFYLYKNIFRLYGFDLDSFDSGSVLVKSVPNILYNYLIDWNLLLNELAIYFSGQVGNFFEFKRLNFVVLDIFIKNIHVQSPCYDFELDDLYDNLVKFKSHDSKWFLKNCYKFFYKRIKKN